MRESVSGNADLRFAVLGPIRAWRGNDPLPTGSPNQRALLTALLLREGRTATAAELIDALWGDEPPPSALAVLRTYASRVRKLLGPEVLVSESGGYAIRSLPESAVDLGVAQEQAREAEEARGAGDLHRARATLNQVLALWDGEPLAGVPGPYADAQRARLEEWRLQLLESRLDMDLEQGAHAEAVSELTALTAAHPLRERLRELLMLALYRSGRQAEALAVYADTRRLLAEELGVDPRPGLRELQQRILQADPDLAEPSPPASQPAAPIVVPAQLPASVADFTGREQFVAELLPMLVSADDRVMVVTAVSGIGGMGKTTLAVHVAQEARDWFPGGQLYADLQGAGPRPASPDAVLGGFLRALGMAESAIPDSLEQRAALYRSVLRKRRVLVLLDNARDAAQVRPLLPGAAGCAVLVTSRVRMVDLAGAHLVDVDVMAPDEALSLFTKIVGGERVAAEREAALQVVGACGFLPLAIRIAASRLAARRTWTVSVLAAKLADERRRLDELRAGDLAVKATFELGYEQLEPGQARAFRLLSLPDGPDISLAAAAAVLDLPLIDAEDLLESLVDTSLLESSAPGRYRYHDLVRLYARTCVERDDQPFGEQKAAMSRLLHFYSATAARVYAIEQPRDRLVDNLATSEHPRLGFTDGREARDWLYTEASCLLSVLRQSTRPGLLGQAVDTLWVSKELAESGTHSQAYEATALTLRDAAYRAVDHHAEARALLAVAHAHLVAGRFDAAGMAAERAAELSADTDPLTYCWALNTLGVTATHQGRYEDGETHLSQAIAGFRACGDRTGEAAALCSLSRNRLLAGATENAVSLARQGKEIYDETGHAVQGAEGRYALGLALDAVGETNTALKLLAQALEVFSNSRRLLWQGMTLIRIAQIQLSQGDLARAAASAEASLPLLRVVGGDWRRAHALTVMGRTLDRLGRPRSAATCWREALSLYERVDAPEADSLRELLGGHTPSAAISS
ncbi:BTAD domain-containing putative transcriptional regulator [Streptomyces diastatochromogenes]|uniref:AfsR/SARP family transcriptional regulator n=1 Tax=Streptomyces diastatochromogenes TaxID=42236 RepID=UPI0036618C6F